MGGGERLCLAPEFKDRVRKGGSVFMKADVFQQVEAIRQALSLLRRHL